MKIDGRKIAAGVLKDLKVEVKKLKKKKIIPHLAVILVGNDAASISYIKQKQQAVKKIGAKVILHHFKKTPPYQKIAEYIKELSNDPGVHGVIVQRPLPPSLSAQSLIGRISLKKDVDGFLPKTPFTPPIGLAISKILGHIYFHEILKRRTPREDFSKKLLSFLKNKKIVLIGRGETAGQPIAETLSKNRLNFIIINSQTEHPEEYIKQADIVISTVGKPGIVKPGDLKPGVILVGIGIRTEKHKLKGDYEEGEVSKIAAYYTPTPRGTGPVNVACLMQNLIFAAELQKRRG